MRHVKVSKSDLGLYTIGCYEGNNLIQQHSVPNSFDHIGKFVRLITEWLESK